MSTTATRKQSQAIRDEMRRIRSDLPYSVDTARNEVKQLTDWKYYVRSLPITSVIGAAALGFIVVPKRDGGPSRSSSRGGSADSKSPSMIEGLVGAIAAMALRSGTSMIANQISGQFLQRSTSRPESRFVGSERHGPSTPRATPRRPE